MAQGREGRNNILAGLFVIVSIALLAITIVVLSNIGDRFKPRRVYHVRFSVADGAEGLDVGSPVKVGGQRVGRVIHTQFLEDALTGEPTFIDVGIEVDARLKLYSDADFQLIRPLLGTGSTINIASVTGMQRAGGSSISFGPPKVLEGGDIIYGRLGAPGFLAPTDYAKFQSILERVDRISSEVEPKVGLIIADAEKTVANVRSISDDAKERWPTWAGQIGNVIARAEDGSKQFETIISKASAGTDSFATGVEDARKLVASAKAAIDENRKSIDEIVGNVRSLTEKTNTEGYDKVMKVLASAQSGLDSASSAANQVDQLLLSKGPVLKDIIANASLASQQLKLATVEIRAAPWRLLYQPTKKELENELLYNSVRQYSEAVGRLKDTAQELRVLSEQAKSGSPNDQEKIQALQIKLEEAFKVYQQQEKAFLERWSQQK